MPFAQLIISILPENATVDISIVLLKILLVTCNIYFTFKTMPSIHSSVKLKLQCDFVVKQLVDLVTIARFTYASKK